MIVDKKISDDKRDMRARAKRIRQAAARQAGDLAAQTFCDHGLSLIADLPPAIISGYMPIGDEADIRPLMDRLHDAGHQLALPVIVQKGQPLEFRAWAPGTPLAAAQWGILEPAADQAVLEPDILLSPLLAFDDQGYRLGYGGGFYDRSVAALRALKSVQFVGVAFDEQRVDAVPRDAYDQRLDCILTPSGVRKFG